jgi:hypothetical protein
MPADEELTVPTLFPRAAGDNNTFLDAGNMVL